MGLNTDKPLPETVEEAVDEIIDDMPLDERVKVARMSERELAPLKLVLIKYVQSQLEQSGINKKLKKSCCDITGKNLDEIGASTVIIDELWKLLRESHRLKIVK
jgi:hypothetical protein